MPDVSFDPHPLPAPGPDHTPRTAFSFEKSIRAAVWEATRIKTAQGLRRRFPSFALDSKIVAHEFTRRLGLTPVEILQAAVPLAELRPDYPCVFKPVNANSAKGVFILFSPENMIYLNMNRRFDGIDALKAFARGLLDRAVVAEDLWLSERLLGRDGEIARDYKFYAFQGEVPLALETRRLPATQRCWFDGQGRIVRTGKYAANAFRGEAPPESLYRLASKVSLAVPAPFVRIDFLCVGDRTCLGEYTPAPGGYSQFDDLWDRRLGAAYFRAALRLCHAVGYGENFDTFRTLEKDEAAIVAMINTRAAATPAVAP